MKFWLGVIAAAGAGELPLAGYYQNGESNNTSQAIYELDFATQTITTGSSFISVQRPGNHNNSGSTGFRMGGNIGSPSFTTARYHFPFATKTLFYGSGTWANLDSMSGMGNRATKGYEAGGQYLSGTKVSDVYSVSYTTFAVNYLTNMSSSRMGITSHANSGVAGYHLGGGNNSPLQYFTDGKKVAFANDSIGSISSVGGRFYQGWFENKGVAGYGVSGYDTSYYTANKFSYTTETQSNISSYNDLRPWLPGASFEAGVAGYLAGGYDTPTGREQRKWLFATDTRSTLSNLPASVGAGSSFTNAGGSY